MPATFLFELVSPEKLLFSGDVEQVTIPGEDGDFGVLAHHAPLISTVRPGVIRVYQNGAVTQTMFVAGGFAEVTRARCTMLADAAEEVSKIDAVKAQAEYQQYLQTESPTATDHQAKVQQERRLAIARARVAAAGAGVPSGVQQPERVGAH